ARLRIRPRHIEAAERMNIDKRARAFAVDIQVANVKFAPHALNPLSVRRIEPSGKTVDRIVGDRERVIEVPGFYDCENRTEYLLLRDASPGIDIGNHSRGNEISRVGQFVSS